MRRLLFVAAVSGALTVALVGASFAGGKDGKGSSNARATLTGFQETPSISTAARGEFRAKINKNANTIDFRLTYSGIEGGTATMAHIHLGERHTAGGVSVWLCGGGGKPACPTPGGTVTGTIVAGDVVGPAGQGLAAGEYAELLRAMRAGATYVNVHSTTYPSGEIRGQIKAGGKGRD